VIAIQHGYRLCIASQRVLFPLSASGIGYGGPSALIVRIPPRFLRFDGFSFFTRQPLIKEHAEDYRPCYRTRMTNIRNQPRLFFSWRFRTDSEVASKQDFFMVGESHTEQNRTSSGFSPPIQTNNFQRNISTGYESEVIKLIARHGSAIRFLAIESAEQQ
jgi:hypothetical protein